MQSAIQKWDRKSPCCDCMEEKCESTEERYQIVTLRQDSKT